MDQSLNISDVMKKNLAQKLVKAVGVDYRGKIE